jgi:hypothetical protein
VADDEDGSSKLHELALARPERARWIAHKDVMRAKSWVSARDPIEGFAIFRAEGQATKDAVAALVAGHMLQATTSAYSDGRTPRMICELANYIEQESGFGRWRDSVELDEAFFSTFSHKARVALLEQWGLGDRAKGLKTSETAAFCARLANCDDADAKLLGLHPDDLAECVNWLPEFMETGLVSPLEEVEYDDEHDFPEQSEDEGEMSDAA